MNWSLVLTWAMLILFGTHDSHAISVDSLNISSSISSKSRGKRGGYNMKKLIQAIPIEQRHFAHSGL